MSKKSLITQISENAEKIRQKNDAIKLMFKQREKDRQSWEKACQDFHATYDQLAFPGGLEHGINLLKEHDPATIQTAIVYLEVDPYFHRSGYIKQKIIRLLKKSELSQEQIKQLHALLLSMIQHAGHRREFVEYCRLAKKIQTHAFVQQIRQIISTSSNADVIEHAEKMLAIMAQ